MLLRAVNFNRFCVITDHKRGSKSFDNFYNVIVGYSEHSTCEVITKEYNHFPTSIQFIFIIFLKAFAFN